MLMKPHRSPGHSPADLEIAAQAAARVVTIHQHLAGWMKPGMTLAKIDAEIARLLTQLQCKSAFLGYKMGGKGPAFPSQACLSVNECVVHGTAASLPRPLQQGDVLKVDIGVVYRGFIGDAGWTYHFGKAPSEVRRLMDTGKRALAEGVKELRPGNVYLNWAKTVQRICEHEAGFHLVRGLGGHGYGRTLHAPPFVSNTVPEGPNDWAEAHYPCTPGTLVAVEPMLAAGTSHVVQAPKAWPVLTADRSMSVHYEHDVLITAAGPRVLTDGLQDVPDEIA